MPNFTKILNLFGSGGTNWGKRVVSSQAPLGDARD